MESTKATVEIQREATLKRTSTIRGRNYEEEEPLLYHSTPIPGKYTIKTTKPMNN